MNDKGEKWLDQIIFLFMVFGGLLQSSGVIAVFFERHSGFEPGENEPLHLFRVAGHIHDDLFPSPSVPTAFF